MRPLSFILPSLAAAIIAAFFYFQNTEPPAASGAISKVRTAIVAPDETISRLLKEAERCVSDTSLGREIAKAVRLIQQRPENADAWVRLGDALLQHSRDTLDASLYAPIKKIYFEAHRRDGANADALVGLAWATGASHRFEDSIAWARKALAIDAELPAAYGILGDADVELGRYEDAERNYQRMLDLRPDMGSYSRAAHLLYLQGNATRGIALMRQAIRAGGANPEHTAWCIAQLAGMLCREGAAPSALQLVEASLRHAPENVLLLAASGHARMACGDDAGAIAAYERAIARSPQHEALAALHDLYLAAGRGDDARRIADRVRQLHLTLQAQRVLGGEGQLARFLADRGENLEQAVKLAEAEFAHHHTATSADTLAWALHRAGRNAEAGKMIRVALRRRVADPAILYHAGVIEEAAGNFQDARRHFYAALSREPRFNPVHAPLAQAAIERLGSAHQTAHVGRSE